MPRSPRRRLDAREIDPEGAEQAVALARNAGVAVERADVAELVAYLGAAAPAVLGALLRMPPLALTLAAELSRNGGVAPARLPPPTQSTESLEDVRERLRRMRNEALARTALREITAQADVDSTAREWSEVAAACTAHALEAALAAIDARGGPPLDERGARVPVVVLGMGKLGGGELNLGSDIDICYFYGTDEGAAGSRTLNEYFGRVGALVADLLGELTASGLAFRVDLRLRPEGTRGPVANSLASAERYYETWGRSWERAALLRARPIAGHDAFGRELLDALRPFVYRRAVDPAIAREMSQMLARVRREQLQDDARDLKIGHGGIREAEFFVQSLQLIWGGRHPSLQVTNTLVAAQRLQARGLLSHREARRFNDAWALLRRVEHRVQVMAAYETHLLPAEPRRQRALARSLDYPEFESLRAALEAARATVRELFASLFAPDESSRPSSTPPGSHEAQLADLIAHGALRGAILDLAAVVLGVRDPEGATDDLLRLARRVDLPLGAVTRDRHPALGPRLLAEVRDAPDPDRALSHLADLFGRLRGAERYAARLVESPEKTRGLVGLLGASEALSKTLLARPELIDAVVTGGSGAPDADEIATQVASSLAIAVHNAAADDDLLDVAIGCLRRVQREIVLEIGLADMAGVLVADDVTRRLSSLAEAVVRQAFDIAASEAAERYGTSAGVSDPLGGIAVFALGSLAALELGYGGDLDIIVLYERDGETGGGRRPGVAVAEYVARLTQRAILFLSSPHAQGPGYAIDTRLRPSGSQGTLVVSLDAFQRYHAGRPGHPRAAAWERQALIRARPVAGDAVFGARAAAAVERVAYLQGACDGQELVRLRARIERELGREDRGAVALKYGRGGLIDVEFATQALQMAHGEDAGVRSPSTRRALLALVGCGHIDGSIADDLLVGESLLRRATLASRLVSERSMLVPGTAATTTVARKLGYRARGGRGAEAWLLDDLRACRERVRQAFAAVTRILGAA